MSTTTTSREFDDPGYAPGPGDAFDPAYLRARVVADPMDWRRWFQLGKLLINTCEDQRGLEAFQEVLRMKPENGLAHRYLALAKARLGAPHAEVFASATRAVELRGDDPHAWALRGGSASGLGRVELALDAFERLVRLEASAETYWRIGICLDQLERPREAIVALEEAVRLQPNHLPALLRLYRVARDLGEEDTARWSLEALFYFNPVRARELMEQYRARRPCASG